MSDNRNGDGADAEEASAESLPDSLDSSLPTGVTCCGDTTSTKVESPAHRLNDITGSRDGGVLKQVKRPGEAQYLPVAGDTVVVHYVGRLVDGTQFDSSRERGIPFTFRIGRGITNEAITVAIRVRKEVYSLASVSIRIFDF